MTLSKKFIQEQKEALLIEKEKIDRKIKKLKKYPDYGQDEEDKLQEIGDFENNLSLESEIEDVEKKIDKALLRIEKGTYGQCTDCKGDIEKKRLEIMPYAEFCITCKAKKSK